MFLLYSRLAALGGADGTAAFRGLGSLDSRRDTLAVRFALRAPVPAPSDRDAGRARRGRRAPRRDGGEGAEVVEVELAQDKTALRSRKGVTGSVLWRARCVALDRVLPSPAW